MVVRFITPKYYAESQGIVQDDELIECQTPDVVNTIGPKECEIRLATFGGARKFFFLKFFLKHNFFVKKMNFSWILP